MQPQERNLFKIAGVCLTVFCMSFLLLCSVNPPKHHKENLSQGNSRPSKPAKPHVVKPSPPNFGGILEDGTWKFGYEPNKIRTQEFLSTLPKPLITQAGPELFRNYSEDKPVLLYRALYEAHRAHKGGKEWVVKTQGIGDCVSWGWAHGCDIHLAVMWKLRHTPEWREAATEAIYGGSRVEARGVSRGGYSDGSYGAAAAKWVRDWGVVFRQPYNDFGGTDLSSYSASRAKDWGNYGCGGQSDNGRLDEEAKRHPVRNVALVRNFKEAAAAIASGYPVPVCSGQGFSSTRDGQGFCRPSGSWAHCMCFIGVRYDRPGLLCLNSWGPDWVSGAKWPEDQPEGSFWVDSATCDRMLGGEDSFAVSGYEGFPFRKLTHGDWVDAYPPKPLSERLYGPLIADSIFSLAP